MNDSVKARYFQRSNLRGFLVLARDVIFLCALLALAVNYGMAWWFSLPLIWAIGAVQFAMGEALLHEASHYNLFKTRALNVIVGNLIAYAIFTTLKEWRSEHVHHHSHLLSASDHVITDYESYRLKDGIHPLVLWLVRPLFGIVGVKWIVQLMLPGLRHVEVWLFHGALIMLAWALGSLELLLWFWFLPLVWAFSSFLYWSEVTDHHLADRQSEHHSRTNRSLPWNFLFHNGGYHWVHHQFAYIPWYLLPQADSELAPADVPGVAGWWGMYKVMARDYALSRAAGSHV